MTKSLSLSIVPEKDVCRQHCTSEKHTRVKVSAQLITSYKLNNVSNKDADTQPRSSIRQLFKKERNA